MSEQPRRIAAIDLGSNSFHLTLAEVDEHGIKAYHREKQKVRLAAGLDANGLLDEEAIDRAHNTLTMFGQILEDFQPNQLRAVGTYTFRSASNIQQLLDCCHDAFPYPIEILSGQEEARLIFQGVSRDYHCAENTLVIDIGGGSTELIIGKNQNAKLLHSCEMGCVSFTSRFFADGKITKGAFQKAILHAEYELEPIRQRYLSKGWSHTLGSSGTIKSLSLCAEALKLSDGTLTLEVLNDIKSRLIDCGHRDKIDVAGISEDRIPVICGGLAVLIAVFDLMAIDELQYCNSALREGLLEAILERMQHKDIRHHAVEQLRNRFSGDTQQAVKVQNTAINLFNEVKDSWQLNQEDDLNLLKWACQLHEVGLQISNQAPHKHAFYIAKNADLPGFNTQQQNILAFMVLSQRKPLKIDQQPGLNKRTLFRVLRLILLLRIAIRLNQFRQNDERGNFEASAKKDSLHIVFHANWKKRQELFSADLMYEQEQFGPQGIDLTYEFQ